MTTTVANGSVVYSDDATASGGRQVITIDRTGHATILFIAGVGYVQADAQGLAGFFGLPQSQAVQLGGPVDRPAARRQARPEHLRRRDRGITLSSVADELALERYPRADRARHRRRPAGRRRARALPASDQTARLGPGRALPDRQLADAAGAVRGNGRGQLKSQMSFSHWGETLHLTAPANAIPASSVSSASTTT